MRHSLTTSLRRHWEEVMRIKTDPASIAWGFAVGTFIAILPLLGMSIFVGFAIVLIWKTISKISLFAALAVWNPIVLIPVYTASYSLGKWLFGDMPVIEVKLTFLQQAYHFTVRFLVGNLIIAVALASFSYLLVYFASKRIQNI